MSNSISLKQRVLIVDDEPAVCQSLRTLLRREGYEVATAWSGAEALTLLGKEEYHLVITDFTMSGMRGDELARTIHERCPQICIIMLTASADLLRSSATELPGVDFLMNKPFVMEQFRKTIAMILSTGDVPGSSSILSETRQG